MRELSTELQERLIRLGQAMIDQQAARVIVEPYDRSTGFWFGGGNIVQDPADGSLLVCGRYRNVGDSRTGVGAGQRGLEMAIFKSTDNGKTFNKIRSWTKADLTCEGQSVVSIEGVALRITPELTELFVSTEKAIDYPKDFSDFQKPGTGVWTIDLMQAPTVDDLQADSMKNVLSSSDPTKLHIKDPVVTDFADGRTALLYCQHPFSWSCSFTGAAIRPAGSDRFEIVSDDVLPKGYTWDIAVSRITERLAVPKIGPFADLPDLSIYFYDGAECVRQHEQSSKGVQRPRGYSCEEIGGLAYGFDDEFPKLHRLSKYRPMFCSPDGTGCSRYVSTLWDGQTMFATWQRSMSDLSQPLVLHAIDQQTVKTLLS